MAQTGVWVVSSRPLEAESICNLLLRQGYAARVLDGAGLAESLAQRARPHLVLFDLGEPGSDQAGYQPGLVRELAAGGVAMLLLAGREWLRENSGRWAGEPCDFCLKPLDSAELLARVRSALARQEWLAAEKRRARLVGARHAACAIGHDVGNALVLILGTCQILLRRASAGDLPDDTAQRLETVILAGRDIKSAIHSSVEGCTRAIHLLDAAVTNDEVGLQSRVRPPTRDQC